MSVNRDALFAKDELTKAEEIYLRSNNLFEAWETAGNESPAPGGKGASRRSATTATPKPLDTEAYSSFSLAELQTELKERGLPPAGNKSDLVTRLEEDDDGGNSD